jgi:tetratricopeptide (TPR) repeat protein
MDTNKKDFFISYTHDDEAWATWIAGTLENAGYKTIIQAWNFKPGMDFVGQIQNALKVCERFIAIVSKEYLSKQGWAQREWTFALAKDKELEQGLFIPVWIDENMKPEDLGLFSTIVAIDLFGKSDEEAKQALINGVSTANRPRNASSYPGTKRALKPGELPFNNLPYPNKHFIGHVEELEEIRRNFQEEKNVSLQAVIGIGGIGKTAIALEYAYRYGFKYECVWWVNAESAATIESNYSEFANKKRIVDAASMDVVVQAVKNWMLQHDKWLFVYDNAEELATLDKYLPGDNPGQRHILITSRNNVWHSIATTVDTEVFSPEDAKAFLDDYTKLTDTTKQEELIEALGRLPLALEQAAAYIYNVRETTYASYLEQYKRTHLEILKRYPNTENKTVYTTWNISFDKIMSESAKQLLNLCAFFASENLPYRWFAETAEFLPEPLQTDVKDELQFGDIRTELIRYSLVRIERDKISMHCLMQEVIRDSLRSEQQDWILPCLRILNKLMFSDFSMAESRAYFLEFVPHIVSVTRLSTEKETEETGNLYAFLGYGFYEWAEYLQALEWYQKALVIREKVLGKEHPDTATICNNIAGVYNKQGKYAQALEWYLKALNINEKVLGKAHPSTASTYNNIAAVYDDQGKYDMALEWYLKALNIFEKVLGKIHPSTATIYNNIAIVYHNQGKYAEALELYFKALAIREKVLGKDHPDTASTYSNIALVFDNQGKYDEALEWNLKALAIYEKVLGKEHPYTATIYNNIAVIYSNQVKYAEALEWYLKALTIKEKILGKDHPDTANTYNNIAVVYDNQGKYAEALEWYQKALDIFSNILGVEHPSYIAIYNNIAGVYESKGDYSKSEEWYLKTLNMSKKTLGESHPYTITILNNIKNSTKV